MHETLLSADEAMRSEDLGDYFRVRPDNRDLNYSLPSENVTRMNVEEFNSFNSKFLNVNDLVDVLLKQEFVKKFLVN